jgi:2-desacetyl-2-hydroxyethyl bacteriochlorophyllide A dehydrogenase
MQSRNIVFVAENHVEVREEPVPEPGPDEALVQTHKTLISTGTEGIALGRLFESGTHWDNWVKFPFAPGYSLAGRVRAVGSQVTDVRPGERVAIRAKHREYVVAKAGSLHRIPDAVTDEDATWLGLASIVQNGVRRAQHELGDNVVVVGVGLLGQLVVQYTRLLGARQIIAIDPWAKRVEMARAHGATHGLALPVERAREQVLHLTGGGADVVYDVTGNALVLEHALPLVRRFGRLLLLGDTGTPSQQRLTRDVVPPNSVNGPSPKFDLCPRDSPPFISLAN